MKRFSLITMANMVVISPKAKKRIGVLAGQLAMKWAWKGPQQPIDVGEDFIRLTLDIVALCSMGFRFNSYMKTCIPLSLRCTLYFERRV